MQQDSVSSCWMYEWLLPSWPILLPPLALWILVLEKCETGISKWQGFMGWGEFARNCLPRWPFIKKKKKLTGQFLPASWNWGSDEKNVCVKVQSFTSDVGCGACDPPKTWNTDVRAAGWGWRTFKRGFSSHPTFPLPWPGLGRKRGFSGNQNVFFQEPRLLVGLTRFISWPNCNQVPRIQFG